MTRGAGLVRKRAAAQRMLLAAAAGVVLPALVLMTLIRMHAAVAERDGVRHALDAIPDAQRSVHVTFIAETSWSQTAGAQLQSGADGQIETAFQGVTAPIERSAASIQYNLTGQPVGHESAYFWSTPEITANATLTAGAWPAPIPGVAAGTAFDAAVPEAAAKANHWKVGDVVPGGARIGTGNVSFRISGIFEPKDLAAEFWQLDPFHGTQQDLQDQMVYGPFVVDHSATDTGLLALKQLDTVVRPRFESVAPATAAQLSAKLAVLDEWVRDTSDGVYQSSLITDDLSQLAQGIDSDRAISARLILLPVVELALLALTALMLTTRLLAEHRRETDGLLRARGASRGGLVRIGLTEGVALAFPIAAVAPYAARVLLDRLSGTGWSSVQTGDVSITGDLWATALGGAALAALMLAFAGLRSSGSFVEVKRQRSRSTARTVVQRNGADVMIAVLGAGALWEVSQYGSGAAHSGSLGLPLVVAPSVLLLAGSVLALRLLPLVVGAVEWTAARRRGAVPALAGWRLGRTARAYAAPMTLLIMAVAVGVQAVVFVSSANRSAEDQAAFDTGSDVRLSGVPAAQLGLSGRLAAVPGTGNGLAVIRDGISVGTGGAAVPVTVLGIDPSRSARVVSLRSDLASESWPTLAAGLETGGWDAHGQLGGITLPGEPKQLSVDVRFTSATAASQLTDAEVDATLVDAYGLGITVPLGTVGRPDGAVHTLTADVDPAGGTIAYPLRISALSVRYNAPQCNYDVQDPNAPDSDPRCAADSRGTTAGDAEQVTIALGGLRADGHSATVPAGSAPVLIADAPGAPTGSTTPQSGTRLGGGPGTAADLLTLTESSGFGIDTVPAVAHLIQFTPHGAVPAAVPAIAGGGLLAALHEKVGDTMTVADFGVPATLRFTASVAQTPTTAAGQAALILPIGFLDQIAAKTGNAVGLAEWWARTAPGTRPAQLAAAYSAVKLFGVPTVTDRQTEADTIRQDPMRSGVRLTLVIAALAALLFILIGFALHSVIAARERATELALLNALGLSRRKTAAMLLVEQAMLVLLGTVAGAVLAVVTIRSVLPLMILTDTGAPPVPRPLLLFDVPVLAAVGGVAALFLLGTVGLVVTTQRREGLARALRMGEDR